MRQALEGILFEGNQIGHECEAQWIIDHFRSVAKESFENICRACIRLYTMESFLYRLVNTALRDNDLSKVDTLGPFCYLIFQFYFAQEFKDLKFIGRVYRGANLSPSLVAEYEQAIGNVRSWLGLTSTTRQRQIAESFADSTVLFIIDIQESAYCSARVVANLSMYPYEDEVLVRAGIHFTIDKIERNPSSKSHIRTFIYLTIEY
jgi:hypothetical protein